MSIAQRAAGVIERLYANLICSTTPGRLFALGFGGPGDRRRQILVQAKARQHRNFCARDGASESRPAHAPAMAPKFALRSVDAAVQDTGRPTRRVPPPRAHPNHYGTSRSPGYTQRRATAHKRRPAPRLLFAGRSDAVSVTRLGVNGPPPRPALGLPRACWSQRRDSPNARHARLGGPPRHSFSSGGPSGLEIRGGCRTKP